MNPFQHTCYGMLPENKGRTYFMTLLNQGVNNYDVYNKISTFEEVYYSFYYIY
jgi:hypothetical protein